jgi:hypothetical protein
VAATGDIYAGLWYPIGVSVMTFVIGSLFLPRDEGSRDPPRGVTARFCAPLHFLRAFTASLSL